MARAQMREPNAEDGEAQAAPEEPETQETPAEGQDSPVLDLTDAAVKRLIRAAKQRGYVTLDELNSVLPSDETSPEQIEDIMAMLNDMGINVIETNDGRR
jgi:RNA polymerase primary sigma factor